MKQDPRMRIGFALLALAGLLYTVDGFFLPWLFSWQSPERWLLDAGSLVIAALLTLSAALFVFKGQTPRPHRITRIDDPSRTIRLDGQGTEQPPQDTPVSASAVPEPRPATETKPTDVSEVPGPRRPLLERISGRPSSRPYRDVRVIVVMVLTPALVYYWLIGAASIWYPILAVVAILGWVFRNFD